jgi:FkbM family methyltransferase
MHYDFVDIGTCDFDTSLDYINDASVILLVEPLTYYLDKLPDLPNVVKDNVGVSDRAGVVKIYYLPEYIIEAYNLPHYLSGCSKVGTRHPTTDRVLQEHNLSLDLVQSLDIEVITIDMLYQRHQIDSIGSLKIDTEGHEEYILPSVLEKIKNGFQINQIKFENQQILGNWPYMVQLTYEFTCHGYRIQEQTEFDITLVKNT